MALFGPFTNGSIVVNTSSDLSAYCKSWELKYNAAMVDMSVMGQTSKVNMAGVKEWSVTAEFVEDIAAVDAILYPLVGAAAFPIVLKPDATSANPNFTGNVVLDSSPIGGNHGSVLSKKVTFHCAGTLTRATT